MVARLYQKHFRAEAEAEAGITSFPSTTQPGGDAGERQGRLAALGRPQDLSKKQLSGGLMGPETWNQNTLGMDASAQPEGCKNSHPFRDVMVSDTGTPVENSLQ